MSEIESTSQEQQGYDDLPVTIDEAWIVARLVAIMYFIEFQYGNEASTVIEQVAKQMEENLRRSEGNVQ
ncbi:MAG: hypothetical protein EBU84_06795 [Actinobacteria bacterium]|jgi:hypothetical protein|nr:hypothetical protein [Actinomycetota bacterium]